MFGNASLQGAAVGLGWAALPAVTVDAEVRSGDLTLLDGPALPDCDVRVITHPRRHHDPAVHEVITQIRRAWASC